MYFIWLFFEMCYADFIDMGDIRYEIIFITWVGAHEYIGDSFKDLIIPSTFIYKDNLYIVKAIQLGDFKGLPFTGRLVLPDSNLEDIGQSAFEGCSGFTGSLTIPDSVTTIYTNAFLGCSGFDGTLTIGKYVKYIYKSAFEDCYGFTGSLTIPDLVNTLSDRVFCNCYGFNGTLTIGKKILALNSKVFYGCRFTGQLIIPDGIYALREDALAGCTGFTGTLTIPGSVTLIGTNAFSGCTGFTDVHYLGIVQPNFYNKPFDSTNIKIVYVSESYPDETFCGIPINQRSIYQAKIVVDVSIQANLTYLNEERIHIKLNNGINTITFYTNFTVHIYVTYGNCKNKMIETVNATLQEPTEVVISDSKIESKCDVEEPQQTEIPTKEIPTVDIPAENIPTVDIPTENIPAVDTPTVDIATELGAIAYCTETEKDEICTNMASKWISFRLELKTSFELALKNSKSSSSQIYSYKYFISKIEKIGQALDAKGSINDIFPKVPSITKELFIFQYGNQKEIIDFSKLPQTVTVHLIGLDSIEFDFWTIGKRNEKRSQKYLINNAFQEFGIHGDDYNKLSQLTTYWGRNKFESNVKVSNIRFIESAINNEEITFESKSVTMDPITIRNFNPKQLTSPCESFTLLIPDEITDVNATFKKESLVIGANDSELEFTPKVFSKNEIGIITSATNFKAAIDKGVEKIEYPLSFTIESEEEVQYEFVGDNWGNLTDKALIKFIVQIPEKVKIKNIPEKVEIEVSKNEEEEGDNTGNTTGNNSGFDKPVEGDGKENKFGPGHIAGVVIACIVVVAVIIGIVFFLNRKKERNTSSENEI
ncbi:hypothetical protein TRFO_32541 [Tritrichomonas foetus]|uniref:Surface antigen BspA-like n=1 Tax=Tritrichomonas foetus TaxID=1144522 RepID=A0A1J4JTS9_9EUKA|nr:hypothetical protein TRFO_32541 [Tritrichomonas foetus]|eukprot:OHT00685.1 hypothetical protein TRFO_32541 [Tritrichomonas foetus]